MQVAPFRSSSTTRAEWRRSYSEGWAHDLEVLEHALRPDTRLVYVNTPHNPTGTQMPRLVLDRVIELAAERGAWLFCDEVYRELEHDPADRLPAAVDLYERAISLGSVSKTYGLPGLRLGWLASRDRAALERVLDVKHYPTICSSAPSELLSEVALRNRAPLVERNRDIVRRNLPLLNAFLERHDRMFSWVRPVAGPNVFRTTCRYRWGYGIPTTFEGDTAVSEAQRLTSWIDWYRFARHTLELGHAEAAAYASARFVEEQNRDRLRDRGDGPALPTSR